MATTLLTPKTRAESATAMGGGRWHRILPLAALVFTLVLLGAACGGDSSSPQSAGSAAGGPVGGGDDGSAGEYASATGYGDSDSSDAAVTVAVAQSAVGEVLSANGRSIYVFDSDLVGGEVVSNCEGECLAAWPAVDVGDGWGGDGVDGDLFETFTRSDGVTQLAVNGRPLYYYSGDASPGDINGQGVGGVWWLTNPQGVALDGNQDGNAEPTSPTPAPDPAPPAPEPQMDSADEKPDDYCPADMAPVDESTGGPSY